MELSLLQGVVWILWPVFLVVLFYVFDEVRQTRRGSELFWHWLMLDQEDWVEGWERIVNDSTRPYDWKQDGT